MDSDVFTVVDGTDHCVTAYVHPASDRRTERGPVRGHLAGSAVAPAARPRDAVIRSGSWPGPHRPDRAAPAGQPRGARLVALGGGIAAALLAAAVLLAPAPTQHPTPAPAGAHSGAQGPLTAPIDAARG